MKAELQKQLTATFAKLKEINGQILTVKAKMSDLDTKITTKGSII